MKPIPLSIIDLFFSGADSKPTTLAFWFAERLPHSALQRSLDEIAAVFYPARAKLVELDSTTLALGDFGRRVSLARVDLRHAGKSPEGLELMACFEEAGNTPERRLLTATHVLAPKGSILIVSVSHVLGDAAALFELLFSWSRLHQGLPIPAPELDRSHLGRILGAGPGPSRRIGATSLDPGSWLAGNHGFVAESETPYGRATIEDQIEVLRFPRKSFAEIAGELMVRRAHELASSAVPSINVTLVCPVDLRRVLPELPRRYFGNAIKGTAITRPIAEVLKRGAAWAAAGIDETIRATTYDSLAADFSLVDGIRRRYGYNRIQRLRGSARNGILLSDLSYFPARLLVFGDARCERALVLSPCLRSAALLPHPDGYQVIRVKPREAHDLAG